MSLVVLTGPSAVGKTTTAKTLEKRAIWRPIITATTRLPREKDDGTMEVDGVDYHFRTPEQFAEDEANSLICQKTVYAGNSTVYGTYGEDAMQIFGEGDFYCVMEAKGFSDMRKLFGDRVIGVFLKAEKHVLEHRLRNRKGITGVEIEKRLGSYDREMATADQYDHVIDVTDLTEDQQAEAILKIVSTQLRIPENLNGWELNWIRSGRS